MLRTLRSALPATGALLALAAAVAPAGASAKVTAADVRALPSGGTIEDGQATLTLSSGAASKLKSAGVSIVARGGNAEAKGRRISMEPSPKTTVIDTMKMRGSAPLMGRLTFKGRRGSANLTSLTLEPGKSGKVTAKLGKRKLTLGALRGGKARFVPYAQGILNGATFKLSKSGARALSRATGGGFSAGTFAKVKLDVMALELPLSSGTATATLDPAFMTVLQNAGITLTPADGATINGAIVTLPMIGGAFDPIGLTGRLAFGGRVIAQRGADQIELSLWSSAISRRQKDVFVNTNARTTAAVATVDVSQMEAGLDGTRFHGTGAAINFTQIGVAALKTSFGVVIPAGSRLATVNVTGVSPAGG